MRTKIVVWMLLGIPSIYGQARDEESYSPFHSPQAQHRVEALEGRVGVLEKEILRSEVDFKASKIEERISRLEDHEATARWLVVIVMTGIFGIQSLTFRTLWSMRRMIGNGGGR